MKFERDLYGFAEDFGFSPLPMTRESSASVRVNMNYLSGDSDSGDEFSMASLAETEEGRLSRSLQTWMPEHIWSPVEPREKPPLEPVFSGRLGKEVLFPKLRQKGKKKKVKRKVKESSEPRCHTAPVRRARSKDSLETSLSLLSCSSRENEEVVEQINIKERRRRRRKVVLSRASTTSGSTDQEKPESIWVKFASKSQSILSKMMRTKTVMVTEYGGYSGTFDNESEAFKHLDIDEQQSLNRAGLNTGIRYVNKTKLCRSSSLNNVSDKCSELTTGKKPLKRVMSSSCMHPWGKPLDIAQIKREKLAKLMALEQARQQEKEKSKRLRRQRSRSITNVPQAASSVSAHSQSVISGSVQSISSDARPESPCSRPTTAGTKAERVTVWKNDREILEIDLKRELTIRVQKRIDSTRNALKRCTGMGDNNKRRILVGTHDEYPKHIENDYSYKPRIIQKMRISPHLSGVIHNDIQVRMGRPRYHEIRVDDLAQWNKGQSLGRAHRNLKVFNWLHSLCEEDFIKNVIPEILDEPPTDDVTHSIEMLHVESADEPDVKPLFKQYEVRIL